MSENILARYGMGRDPWGWRSDMDAPQNALAPVMLSQGPVPSGYDRVRDAIYNALGGQPTNAWAANKLATAFDVGTLGMATGAYDGGQELARTGQPGAMAMALMPGMKPVGAAAKAAAPVAKEAVQGIRAYHGSPHDFDRFDMSKIGTGEGAQAYGHGLYFAENEGVAKQYRNTVSPDFSAVKINGRAVPNPEVGYMLWKHNLDPTKALSEVTAAADMYEALGRADTAALFRARANEIREAVGADITPPGHTYEVNIKANPDDLLDWDKPLSQQSDKVRSFAGKNLAGYGDGVRDPLGMTGAEFARGLGERQADATPILREAGISGIRYLDQGSRAAGDGSRNYVVFDDSLIEIIRKYGLLPPAALGAAAAGQDPAQAAQ